jgi:hypothetical protein
MDGVFLTSEADNPEAHSKYATKTYATCMRIFSAPKHIGLKVLSTLMFFGGVSFASVRRIRLRVCAAVRRTHMDTVDRCCNSIADNIERRMLSIADVGGLRYTPGTLNAIDNGHAVPHGGALEL